MQVYYALEERTRKTYWASLFEKNLTWGVAAPGGLLLLGNALMRSQVLHAHFSLESLLLGAVLLLKAATVTGLLFLPLSSLLFVIMQRRRLRRVPNLSLEAEQLRFLAALDAIMQELHETCWTAAREAFLIGRGQLQGALHLERVHESARLAVRLLQPLPARLVGAREQLLELSPRGRIDELFDSADLYLAGLHDNVDLYLESAHLIANSADPEEIRRLAPMVESSGQARKACQQRFFELRRSYGRYQQLN
jgi:hypothetical protein